MIQTFDIYSQHCLCCVNSKSEKITYVFYPVDILGEWIEQAADDYNTSIVAISGMDWDNDLTPWPATGVPKGSPDFEGNAKNYLKLLTDDLIPEIERRIGVAAGVTRDLVGVSLSGLFTLWQWMVCGTFTSIASLSGSFWYEGFIKWFSELKIPEKKGMAYFSLGDKEDKSKVQAFNSVGDNTRKIVELLKESGIDTVFESVPGTHYDDPIPRLDKAFKSLMRN